MQQAYKFCSVFNDFLSIVLEIEKIVVVVKRICQLIGFINLLKASLLDPFLIDRLFAQYSLQFLALFELFVLLVEVKNRAL